jgi:HEAT repeat protein
MAVYKLEQQFHQLWQIRAIVSGILCCASCQPHTQLPEVPNAGELPTPPYAESSNHQITISDEVQVSFSTATVEDTVASIEKLQARPDRSRYRPHLEELSTQLFQKLATSKEPDTVIMTLLATASCHHPLSRTISRALIREEHPIIQLAAVQALSALNTSDADYILTEALRSDYPVIRLEAGWRIACKRTHDAFFHIDALSHKLPDVFHPYMPELFAIEGSLGSLHRLRQLLFDPNEEVIIETLVAIGRHNISTMGPLVVSMEPRSPAVLEAQAFALRVCDSESARGRLHKLATHTDPCVQIQAALSLIFLHETEYQSTISDLAKSDNLFAIAALGACPDPLTDFKLDNQSQASHLNLSLSLLNQKDPHCIPELKTLLSLPDDQMLYESSSVGHSLSHWDIVSIGAFDAELWPTMKEQSLVAKEALLIQTLELNEASFEDISATVFEEGRVDLYPCLLQLLENQRSEATVQLLRREANRVGAPYNRAFATLALVRLGIENDEQELVSILDFSREKQEQPWRPPLPWMAFLRGEDKSQSQQAAATAQLYITTIEALAERGTPTSIEFLTKELSRTPKKYLPFVVASLLHATL